MNRLRTLWQAVSILTFNLLVILCAGNLLAWLLLPIVLESKRPRLDPAALQEAHPERSRAEIRRIQDETWGRKYVYEPHTQFKEGPVAGDFVHVDTTGFRRPPQGNPWPPNPAALNIFVFGGSTTFGYGIANDETIPAVLERQLHASGCSGARVYNLGRSNYFSTQERILFEQLLVEGYVPNAVVFIDGLNEFMIPDGLPKFTKRLTYLMAESRGQLFLRALKQLPLARLAAALRNSSDLESETLREPSVEGSAREVLSRWQRNRDLIRAVASARGISALFVWQPIPGFTARSQAADSAIPHAQLLERGYELQGTQEATTDLLWLGDWGRSPKGGRFVDRVHYSAQFSSAIASEIAPSVASAVCPNDGSVSGAIKE